MVEGSIEPDGDRPDATAKVESLDPCRFAVVAGV
jgi:hypothetical protein